MTLSVSLEDIRAARQLIRENVLCTPFEHSATLSAQLGCEFFIKFENQQFTASFKERGALNCLLSLGDTARAGVIAMSAGNHAQSLAYHGARLGLPTTIVMPRNTPNAKVEATRVHGAEIILHGANFNETRERAETLARERQLHLVHPFDDRRVIAGQGTVALEMLEQQAQIDVLVVPIGGGGLISGVSTVYKALSPQTEILGVQMAGFPGAHALYNDREPETGAAFTVAEGIAVKYPGEQNMALMKSYVDDILLVDEADVEQAIFDLLEVEKTVAEGAGAAPLALVRSQPERFADKRVGMILSGGNIDMMILSSVLRRGLVRSHRLVRLRVEIPDTPGSLANVTSILGQLDSNIMDIEHQRAFAGSTVRATVVELVLQMRGEEQEDQVCAALRNAGYEVLAVN